MVLTAKIAVGALAATVLAGTGIERIATSHADHVAGADALRPSAEIVPGPLYAGIAALPAWVDPWRADPQLRLPAALHALHGHRAAHHLAAHHATRNHATGSSAGGAQGSVLVASAPASHRTSPRTGSTGTPVRHSTTPQPAGSPTHSSSWHSTTWVHQVTNGSGSTTTRTTTKESTTVGGKTTESTHRTTTVTPPTHRSAPVAATPTPVHGSAPSSTSKPSTGSSSTGASSSGKSSSSN